jgi:hypothetical protein
MKRLALLGVVALACTPEFAERESLVTEPRILAVRAEPAEVEPGEPVVWTALVATPDGGDDRAPVNWAFCATPKLPGENASVSPACAKVGVKALPDVGATVTAPMPGDACALFGPETPPGAFRARDADETGGFYQPLRASWGPVSAFGFGRVTCKLANAAAAVTLEYNQRYVRNENPTLGPLVTRAAGGAVALSVSWGEKDAELYVQFDPKTHALVTRREAMRVSWYANQGSFDADRTGRGESETETFTENVWHPGSGTAWLWVVLRDSRGGTAFAKYTLAPL